jgi:hypothetical protein
MDEGFITTIRNLLLEDGLAEASGTLHLWHHSRKACGGRSHVGGVMSLDPEKFAAAAPEHRCKRCAARFEHLKSKFPNFGKSKVAEDSGLSSDGVATNSAGGGHVDGIGIGPKGEPGARKKSRDARRRNSKLFAAIARGGTVEMSHYNEDDDLAEGDPVVNVAPTIADDPSKDRSYPTLKSAGKKPTKKNLRRGDAEIVVAPELPTRFENMVDESRGRAAARPTAKLDYLVKIGLGDKRYITFYRNALKDPSICVNNATYRPVVARLLNELLDIIMGDPVLYNRLRMQLLEHPPDQGENEVPEDEDERFRRWRVTSGYAIDEAFASLSNAELAHQASSCADPSRKARMFQELRRRTGKIARRP